MVMQLGLGKFYGKSLPRPRIYEDVKFNAERVDPPTPPTAPLISWARDASWSMGGMSSKRKRMQGKIEGSLKKLRDLQDDDDDEKAVDVGVAPDGKTSNPSFVDTRSANEELLTSDEDTEGCSTETSLGVRTPAEKLNEVGLSSSRWIRKGRPNDMRVNEEGGVSDASEGSDSVTGNAFLRRGSRGRKKHDSARAEPVISRRVTVASVRRSGRSSVLRRIRN